MIRDTPKVDITKFNNSLKLLKDFLLNGSYSYFYTFVMLKASLRNAKGIVKTQGKLHIILKDS